MYIVGVGSNRNLRCSKIYWTGGSTKNRKWDGNKDKLMKQRGKGKKGERAEEGKLLGVQAETCILQPSSKSLADTHRPGNSSHWHQVCQC